jgi:hypothetical protein
MTAFYQCFEEPVASIFRIIQRGSMLLRNTANELQTTQHHTTDSSNEHRINKQKIKFQKVARIKGVLRLG